MDMKLYATTTSERATKGQGGNKDILIVITAEIDGERQEIASMSVVHNNNVYIFVATMPDGSKKEMRIKAKGEKKKDEQACPVCGKSTTLNPASMHCMPL